MAEIDRVIGAGVRFGLVGGKAPGPRSLLEDRHCAALLKAVEDGPISAVHGVVRWRVIDLCHRVQADAGP